MNAAPSAVNADRIRRLSEAGDWLLRLNGPRQEAEVSEWLKWCDEGPENLVAFEEMQQDWRDLEALKSPPVREVRRIPVWWSLAATVLIAALGAPYLSRVADRDDHALTAATANKSATLPDGSSVVLGARAQVNVDFTGPRRSLRLSSGAAYFKVRPDKSRPFVVQAGALSVTAVGTAFDVRQESDRIIVTVEEGVVDVSQTQPRTTWRAQAGHQLTYMRANRTVSLASINPAKALSWRHGELAYVWQPLGEVIDDINRYSQRRIMFEDGAIAQLHFTGTVFTASIDDWLRAVQDAYPLHVRHTEGGDIVLSLKEEVDRVQK